MNEKKFTEKYPTLAPTLMGYFDIGDVADEEIARQAVEFSGFSQKDRERAIRSLIADSQRLLMNLDEDWPVLKRVANRHLDSPTIAKEWLSRILGVWEREFRDLEGDRRS